MSTATSNRPQYTLDHIGIVVVDLDAAVAFYRDVLGFDVRMTEPVTDVDPDAIGLPGASVRLRGATLSTGRSELELHEYLEPTGRSTRRVCDTGLGHIAFAVDDIRFAFDHLRSNGVQFNSEPHTISNGDLAGRTWVYGLDPWGVVIELVQEPIVGRASR